MVPVDIAASALAQEPSDVSADNGSSLIDQNTLPNAIELKGSRPQADPSLLPPAATTLPETLDGLQAPPSLALPNQPDQVRIRELRPLTLAEVERLAEVNNPNLKAVALEVQQAKSSLRAAISSWYPTLDLSANGLPQYLAGESQRFNSSRSDSQRSDSNQSGSNQSGFNQSDSNQSDFVNPFTDLEVEDGRLTRTEITSANFSARLNWKLIDPGRVPEIAAARDLFERARDSYLISLRDLRLQTAEAYIRLQERDETVNVGKQSVAASLVSLRDARARFQAGVATKLEVLEAETQLARDRDLLTRELNFQSRARRELAKIIDLPQDVTPTAATPARVLGVWEPSLQESIIAAYAFREELDQLILDISINNSNANRALAAVQPVLSIYNDFQTRRFKGGTSEPPVNTDAYGWSFDNAVGLSARWNVFDGGRARAEYRRNKQKAEASTYDFATRRGEIRFEVEQSFFNLRDRQASIRTTAREVLSSREALRLARLRFQAGVTTQREVVENQRDVTNAQVRYVSAIADYNVSVAKLRRFTGLDQVASCPPLNLPGDKPQPSASEVVPIVPEPNFPACEASLLGS